MKTIWRMKKASNRQEVDYSLSQLTQYYKRGRNGSANGASKSTNTQRNRIREESGANLPDLYYTLKRHSINSVAHAIYIFRWNEAQNQPKSKKKKEKKKTKRRIRRKRWRRRKKKLCVFGLSFLSAENPALQQASMWMNISSVNGDRRRIRTENRNEQKQNTPNKNWFYGKAIVWD